MEGTCKPASYSYIAITKAWETPDSITYLKHLHSKDTTVLDLLVP